MSLGNERLLGESLTWFKDGWRALWSSAEHGKDEKCQNFEHCLLGCNFIFLPNWLTARPLIALSLCLHKLKHGMLPQLYQNFFCFFIHLQTESHLNGNICNHAGTNSEQLHLQPNNSGNTSISSSSSSSNDADASLNVLSCLPGPSTASGSSNSGGSCNANSVNPGQAVFPESTSISIINGTSSTSVSGATATATAFILPDALPMLGTPTNVRFDSAATLYGSLSNGTSGGNFILVSPFIDVTRT